MLRISHHFFFVLNMDDTLQSRVRLISASFFFGRQMTGQWSSNRCWLQVNLRKSTHAVPL
jgi:hypothetical protein